MSTKPTPAGTAPSAPAVAHSERLPLRQPPYDDEVAKTIGNTAFTGLSPQNLRLALAHQPRMAAAFQAMAHQVLFKAALPEREREIAIIRTGALTRSEYEWGMHVSIYADKCGLSPQQITELTNGQLSAALWTDKERLIVQMVNELHHHSTVSDATWKGMSAHWEAPQIIELILSSGFYHMAAFFLNSVGVPLEDGSERFPSGLTQAAVPQ
jgi:alkylhydroperoxidase family enzyme